MILILATLFVILFLGWFYIRTRKPKNFPPGPPRFPIVGSLPYMMGSGDAPSLLFGVSEQVKKHGPIFGFYFGSTPAVILANHDLIKEAFKNDSLAARPDLVAVSKVRRGNEYMSRNSNGGVPGVIFSHGGYWRELRRFLLRNLRDFGFGKTSMEDLFQDEVAKLCQYLSKRCDEPINMSGTMNISIINALWSILVGEKLDLEDPSLIKIVTLVNSLLNGPSPQNAMTEILPHPSMTTWPIIRLFTGFQLANKTFSEVSDMVRSYIEEHERTLDPENIRDFLDLMISEQKKSSDPSSCFNGKVGKATIVNSVIDLFIAGMETTTTSLMIVILHLLHHLDVQEKVHQEIDEVVGKKCFPSLSDKENMPYTSAVLLESLRVGSLAYLGVPHHATADVKIGTYTIPKGATVMGSLYHAMRDPKLFKNPDMFDPTRFIDENGKFVNNENVIPFGVGKRYCLGQSLAEKEFFIFFTGLLQQFEIRHAPGTVLPSYIDINPKQALARSPPPYKVILKKRLLL